MPAKQNSRRKVTKHDVGFVLKHRVAGAGFLLFFGALILPWMLGAPNQADSQDKSIETSKLVDPVDDREESPIPAEDKPVLMADDQTLEQEKTYISKITPLDKGNKQNSSSDAGKNITNTKSANTESTNTNKPIEIVDDKKTEGTETEGTDQQNDIAVSVIDKKVTPSIDVGWVVQVGVFTDKNGAERVVRDLQGKGFKPSTSIVDTNRGKATGTRIWLGPYAQRVDAAKAKTELTNKTGEAGFIRAYP